MNNVDEVKSKINIVDYIGNHVTLKKAGRNFKGQCPFHQEKTPSFIVSPERQIWRCFGACQEGGDIISFLMKWENITFLEALQELAMLAGIKLERIDFVDKNYQKKQKLIEINSLALQYYNYILSKHPQAEKARQYLEKRKINNSLIETFQIGYAPDSFNSLSKFFLSKNKFDPNDIASTGLIIKTQRGLIDRFKGRIMFPIKDPRGNTIGFSGRLLDATASPNEGKYINSPETDLYKKRGTLYGIHITKDAIHKNEEAVIVEGEFDMISSFSIGISNVAAIKGSSLTHEQLLLLKRYCKNIVLALDSDYSGEETTKRAISDAINLDFKVMIAKIDYAKDPDEAIQKNPTQYKKTLKNPIPIYDYIISQSLDKYGIKDAYAKKEIANEIIPYLHDIVNPIIQAHYINNLASTIQVDKKSIEDMMFTYKFSQKKKQSGIKKYISQKHSDRFELLQKYIISILMQHKNPFSFYDKSKIKIENNLFSIPSYNKLIEEFVKYKNTSSDEFNLKTFVSRLSPQLQTIFDELFLFDIALIQEDLIDKSFDKSILELIRFSLKKQIKDTISNKDSDKDALKLLTDKLTKVEKQLSVV